MLLMYTCNYFPGQRAAPFALRFALSLALSHTLSLVLGEYEGHTKGPRATQTRIHMLFARYKGLVCSMRRCYTMHRPGSRFALLFDSVPISQLKDSLDRETWMASIFHFSFPASRDKLPTGSLGNVP